MSTSLCEHLLSLKVEKIANYITKASNYCSGNKKHRASQLGLCLNCGVVRCDDQTNKCSFQHFYGTKHSMVLKMSQKSIYCFACKLDICSMLQKNEESNKKQKITEIYQRIIQQAEKLGERAQIEIVKTEKKVQNNQKQRNTKKHQKVYSNEQENQVQTQQKEQFQNQALNHVRLQVFGLKNLGNTCFFNSTLQCLYACQQLHKQYSNLKFDSQRQFGKLGEINLLWSKYLRNVQKHFAPKGVFSWACKMKSQYKHMDQQDAQQLLALLLNGLIDGQRFWLQIKPKYGQLVTPTQKLFGFFLAGRLECLACEKVSWSLDFSLEISVQLSKSPAKYITLPEGEIPKDQIKIEELFYPPEKPSETFLDSFFAPESLGKQNYFICESCGAEKAWRKFYLKDPPRILVISLKRFNNNLSKNNASVKLPSTLQLDGHCINKGSLVYELFAFVEHSGTARGGHYVAYSKRGNDWFYFSDGTVKGLSWQRVKTCQPYILFYRRVQ